MSSTAVEFGTWRILTVSADQGQAVFRLRTDMPADPAIGEFTTSVRIEWPYDGDESGFPAKADQEWMDLFEDRLSDLLCEEGLSYLVLVTTGLGSKEWLFYTTDHTAFMERFNDRLADLPRFPLAIQFISDPDWEQWESLRRHAGENG